MSTINDTSSGEITPSPNPGDGGHIFISYARKDETLVWREIEWLQSLGFSVWFDRGIVPGKEWNQELADNIDRASHLLYFVTPNSVASRNCRDELSYARSNGIDILAVHLVETELTGGLQLSLGLSQAILKYKYTDREYETLVVEGLGDAATTVFRNLQSGERASSENKKSLLPASHLKKYITGVLVLTMIVILASMVIPLLKNSKVTESRDASSASTLAQAINVEPNSIAVLPFTDLSKSQNQAYLAEGLADTILNVLGGISGLKVAARASTFSFKLKGLDIDEIARKLRVSHLLDGSIQKSGNQIRISARLVDTRTQLNIWLKSFNGPLEDIFSIQDQIATDVARSLPIIILEAEQKRLEDQYRPDILAYEQLLLGQKRLAENSVSGIEAAEEHFRSAIDIDSGYSRAYSSLADSLLLKDVLIYGYQDSYSALPSYKIRQLVDPLISEALALNSESASAHASLAKTLTDPKDAEIHFQKSLALNPNSANTYLWYSDFLSVRLGKYEEALRQAELARELDPLSDNIKYAWIRAIWAVGRAEEATYLLLEATKANPEFPAYYKLMARWKLQSGRAGEAMLWIKELRRLEPDSPSHWGEFGGECFIWGHMGDFENMQDCGANFLTAHPESYVAQRSMAQMSGNSEALISITEGSYEEEPGNDYRANQFAHALFRAGHLASVIEVISVSHQELVQQSPEVNGQTVWPAMMLAEAYKATEKSEELENLLPAIETTIRKLRLIEGPGFISGLEDVEVELIKGNYDLAMKKLEKAVNKGWRFTSFLIPTLPIYQPLREREDFKAILSSLDEYHLEQQRWYRANKDKPLY